jgi:hypothetical protein
VTQAISARSAPPDRNADNSTRGTGIVSDLVEDSVEMHNKALIRSEDHASVLNRVDGWVSDYLYRFKENPAALPLRTLRS